MQKAYRTEWNNNYLCLKNTAEEASAGKHIENAWMMLSEYKTPIPLRS
jgi:hypothetical protein